MNVLFILSEHHNPFFMGCAGDRIARTPCIDRLAEDGARFEYAYCASPHCVPARGALWSGLHSHETRVWCNSTPWDGHDGWPAHLRAHSVHTSAIGKLDFMPNCDHGFDEEIYTTHRTSLDIHSLYREQPIIPRFTDIEKIRGARRWDNYPSRTEDDDTVDAAIDWLNRRRLYDKPWLLNVNLCRVHPTWTAPPAYWNIFDPLVRLEDLPSKYFQKASVLHPYFKTFSHHACADYVTDDDIRRCIVGFYACCAMLDAYVGRLVEAVDKLGLADSTMIVYSSDHGASVHAHRCWTLLNPWEDSIRVPLIIRMPGGRRGVVDTHPTHHHDVMVTISEALGVTRLKGAHGVSLMDAICGSNASLRQECIMNQVHNNGWQGGVFAVSDGTWKYIACAGERPLLFNLAEDPQEMNDLIVSCPKNPETQKQTARLKRWLRGICDTEAVDERAKADQRLLRENITRSGQIKRELEKRGYLPIPERLTPNPVLLKQLGVEYNYEL